MCNAYQNTVPTHLIEEAFSHLRLPIAFTKGRPNLEPREDIRITEPAPIVRRDEEGRAELVSLRWSWPGPKGKPVYNFRSEGRAFGHGRCLIPASGFYEFTDPPSGGPRRSRKVKWRFEMADEPWFCIAGLWRGWSEGQAFTMLTTTPGPDVAPYHDRQVVVLRRSDWAAWLDGSRPAGELLVPSPEKTLRVARVGE